MHGEMRRDARRDTPRCTGRYTGDRAFDGWGRCGEIHGEIRRDERGDTREIAPLMVRLSRGAIIALYLGESR